MKILFLNIDINYGGAEKMLAFVANTFAKDENNEVVFLTYRSDVVKQSLASNVHHVHIQLEDCGGGIGLFSTVRSLRKYIKKENFDVAVAFLSPSQIRLNLACLGLKTKAVVSQRGDPYVKGEGIKAAIFEKINNFLFSLADYFVFQTEKARDFYPSRVKKRSRVIANPISPLKRTVPRTADNVSKKVVSVARLDIRQKRQDLLIDAFCIFNQTHPEYTLEIYGDGADIELIESMAQKNHNIKICGLTSNVAEKIQNAAMFALTSDFEGIPNALLEAMSIGVPCISTDCSPGGAALLIKDSACGILIERDNPEKLAEAMAYFAENETEREKIGLAGMYVNEKFDVSEIASQWVDVVKKVAGKN